MATKRDLPVDDEDRSVTPSIRGFALAPGETAEQFLASWDELLRSEGIEPNWPSAQEIRRKIESGELGT
jgi:hypothetical protein